MYEYLTFMAFPQGNDYRAEIPGGQRGRLPLKQVLDDHSLLGYRLVSMTPVEHDNTTPPKPKLYVVMERDKHRNPRETG